MAEEITSEIIRIISRPYNRIVTPITDEKGSRYIASVLEFPGCQAPGYTVEEAYNALITVMEGWIEARIKEGLDVPEPVGNESYSGRFVLRLPKSLHCRLAMEAQKEGVSLNQYALYKLSR